MFEHHSAIPDWPVPAHSVNTFFDWLGMDSPQHLDNGTEADALASFDDDHWQRIYADLIDVERSMDHPHLQLSNTAMEHVPLWDFAVEKQICVVHNSDTDTSSPRPCLSTESSVDDDVDQRLDLQEWIVVDGSSKKLRPPKLYEFLRLLLNNPRYSSYIAWSDEEKGVFKIKRPALVANLWKQVKVRKSNGCMDYDTFARGIRYYYKSKLMVKTNTRHTYCFARRSSVLDMDS
jgi:hypothetical protein